MNNFSFVSPTQFIFGKDVEVNAGDWIFQKGFKKVLIVYGQGHVVKSGLLNKVIQSLDKNNIEHFEMGGVRPNPEIAGVRQGVEIAKKNNVDFILAIGGGSVCDTSKAIAAAALYDKDAWDLFRRPNPVKVERALPIGVVLTIPAAGSEASDSCVISNDEENLKCSMGGDYIRPVVSWMDPLLTYSLPAWQTAAGITDMCAHIFERFFSSTETTITTDNIAFALLRSIRTSAYKVMRDPSDYDARANIMWLGMLAHNGIAGCGRDEDWTSHAFEHEMSALKPEVTHGAGLAVIMPSWMRFVYKENPERFVLLGQEVFGLSPSSDANQDALTTINLIQDFFVSLGMPRYMEELGFVKEDASIMAPRLKRTRGEEFGSFASLTLDDAKEIYLAAFKN